MPWTARAAGRVSRSNCGLWRDRGTVRTSMSRATAWALSSAMKSASGRVEWPTVSTTGSESCVAVGSAIVPHIHGAADLSVVHPSQRRALVQGDVLGLVALDFILWLSLTRVVGVPFVINVFRVHLDDCPADVPSLRVPGYVIAHLELSLHDGPPRIGRHQPSLESDSGRGTRDLSCKPISCLTRSSVGAASRRARSAPSARMTSSA